MIPVQQTILSAAERADGHDEQGRPGDCLRACVASLLELPADDVPHFAEHADWWATLRTWVNSRGWDAEIVPYSLLDLHDPIRHAIATGRSPRGKGAHCIVIDATGEMAHDPHPSGAGLASPPAYLIVLSDTVPLPGLEVAQ